MKIKPNIIFITLLFSQTIIASESNSCDSELQKNKKIIANTKSHVIHLNNVITELKKQVVFKGVETQRIKDEFNTFRTLVIKAQQTKNKKN